MAIWKHLGHLCPTPVLVLLLMASFVCPAALAAESKRVVLLHSFGREFKPWSEYARTIRFELQRQSLWPIDIDEHSLITARSSDNDPDTPFVEYLRALYANKAPDLIVSIGAPAAAFVQRHRKRLFATTPMVFTAVDQRRVQFTQVTDNDAVVAVWINYRAAIENILQVLPDTKNVMVVVGTSPIEKFWHAEIGRTVEPLAGRVAFTWTNDLSFEALLKRAAALPPHSAIFWELMIVDAAGVVHEGDEPLTRLHAVANAPIFSYDESFFGREIVGGPFLLVEDTSKKTAAVAVRILGGEKAGDIKTSPVEFAKPRFDWRQLQRWSISESLLPPGSEIHFREPSAWERYRVQITVGCLVFLLQAGLISWLVYEHWRRQAAEVTVRNTMTQLAHVNRVATAGEMTVSIAHEIRQPLTGIRLSGQAALNWLKRPAPDVEKAETALQNVVQQTNRVDEVIKNIGAMFKKEKTPRKPLDVNDLIEQILVLTEQTIASQRVAVSMDLKASGALVLGDEIQLQQVLLNLISNAVEAMNSSGLLPRILQFKTMTGSDNTVIVTVTDSGPGINPEIADTLFAAFVTMKSGGMGMGLSICKTIVETHGGQLTHAPATPCGTTFQIVLPRINAEQ